MLPGLTWALYIIIIPAVRAARPKSLLQTSISVVTNALSCLLSSTPGSPHRTFEANCLFPSRPPPPPYTLHLNLAPASVLQNASPLSVAPWTCHKTDNTSSLFFLGKHFFDFCLSLAPRCVRTDGSSCAIARLSFLLALSNPISIFTLINCTYCPPCLSGGEDPRRSLKLETMSLTRTIRVRAAAATT